MTTYQFCTYYDKRYFLKGRALYRSLRTYAEDFVLWVLCLDAVTFELLNKLSEPGVRPVLLADLEAWEPQLASARNDRTLVEYYWTCTPTWLAYVLAQQTAGEWVIYLDADLYFYSNPDPIFQEAGAASILIHEHRYSPQYEFRAATSGIYNVGLTAFRADELGWAAVRWWQAACLKACFLRPEEGYCGDQKYLDDWPERFPGVHVLKHPGAGLAPWNIANYDIRQSSGGPTVDSVPLIFYHFHAFQLFSAHIAWQRGYNFSPVARRGIFVPYVQALQRALRDVETIHPRFRDAFQLPYRLELMDDLRHRRFLWV